MKVRCNMCEGVFDEKDIVYDGEEDKEYCPLCGESGCLMDLEEDEFTTTREPSFEDLYGAHGEYEDDYKIQTKNKYQEVKQNEQTCSD